MRTALKFVEITLRAVARDRGVLFWSFAFPALLLMVLGLIWGKAGTPELKVGLVGATDAPLLTRLNRQLTAARGFTVSRGSRAAEMAALRAGKRHLVLLCTAGEETGQPAVVRAYFDPRQEAAAQLALTTVRQAVTRIERQMVGRPAVLTLEETPIRRLPEHRPSPIENFMPAIIAMTIIQAGLSAAVALVAERQKGSSDIFRVTPVPIPYMVIGNLSARVLLTGLQTMSVILMGLLAFGVGIRGSWWALGLLVVLGTVAFTAIGGALAMLARNVESAGGLVSLVSLPLVFLSGLFFPIDTMPAYARAFALTLPSAYLGDGLRCAVTGVASVAPLSVSIGILSGWTVACFLFSVRFFRWD